MKKVITIVGARPQFIKAAAISRAMGRSHSLLERIIHTGQHYDANMSEIFFSQMSIPKPHYHLGIGGGTHGAMTGRQLEKIEEILLLERPDLVLVYGDTNSTLAGALAAVKLHIPIAHVEAGLRSFNRQMPEEINRVMTDHIATLLFAPTNSAKKNLMAEGVPEGSIYVVGDVMYDVARFYRDLTVKPHWFDLMGLREGEFVLCTIHRAENTDSFDNMRSILCGLAETGLPIVLPLHPRTRQKLSEARLDIPSNIHVVDPVGYLEMAWLEAKCRNIATDSGGVQKEAYFHEKPCVTLRAETEWTELVEAGVNILAGVDARMIRDGLLNTPVNSFVGGLYGKGRSAEDIVDVLTSFCRSLDRKQQAISS